MWGLSDMWKEHVRFTADFARNCRGYRIVLPVILPRWGLA